ncbi:MAG TPA: 4Fe-4S binding protein [Candidatus Binatia bacterium]|jgi:NADH-quinone oxidoreductase subunit I|nr:4Fe-4S binding protein [Candidatus Binatia bacterium]
MLKALTEIYFGVKSLFIGLKITLGQFFKPTVTVRYPHATLKMPARFRGHIELVRDPATGKPKCFVCKLCEKACPSDCITVEGIKPEGARRKTVNYYRLDFTRCSLCGSCVEACRDSAIRFSRDYNLASTNKEDFIMDLFKRLQGEAEVQSPMSKVQGPEPVPANPTPEAVPGSAPVSQPRTESQKPDGSKAIAVPVEAK